MTPAGITRTNILEIATKRDKTLSPERAQIYKCAHKTDGAADSNEAE